ncbi:outer membrane beta-barrel protein [Labilibacter marinus]|uniref:outer membrane beta-barrel protein n=1 Tax=Labilibacter marinus TaxID=1477105 RepID=UPI00094F7259|nr:outer membrane beta-barrel protein [Labilibacter marinus]
MSEKNIDNIFKDGLSDFKETPPAFVWNAIESNLQGRKNNKRTIILWRSIAAAAIIGILFLGGLLWQNNTQQPLLTNVSNIEMNNESISTEESIGNTSSAPLLDNAIDNTLTNTIVINTISSELSNNNSSNTNVKKESINLSNNNAHELANNKNMGVLRMITNKDIEIMCHSDVNATHTFNKVNQSMLNSKAVEYLNFANHSTSISIEEKKKKELKYALGGQFSPSYSSNGSNSNGGASAVNEDGIMSYTGGINLNIKTRKRWAIETGVYYSQVGQKFSNPIVSQNKRNFYSPAASGGIQSAKPNLSNSMGSIKLNNTSNQNLIEDAAMSSITYELNSDAPNNTIDNTAANDITVQQELDYIEVPFLLKYNLVDKTIGISLSGGMSTNFLLGNSAYQLNNSSKEKIGEMANINDVNYTAIFGFGLSAPILKSLDFNFEPRIRYFMNSVSNSGSYQPYSIGFYTGVSYTF